MTGMGTTDSPTPADDLAELRAYAEKGPAVSRATCGRLADRLEAVTGLAVDLLTYWDLGYPPADDALAAGRAALAAEATEPPPHDHDEMLAHLINEWGLLGVVSAALDSAEGKAIDVLNAAAHRLSEAGDDDRGPAPDPQGADEPTGGAT